MVLHDYEKQWHLLDMMLATVHKAERLNGIYESKLQGNHACTELNLSDVSIGCLDIQFALRVPVRQASGMRVQSRDNYPCKWPCAAESVKGHWEYLVPRTTVVQSS